MNSSVIIESYRPTLRDGTLRGYATVQVPAWGIQIRGIGYHVSTVDGGSRWLEMPHRVKPGTGGAAKIYTLRWQQASGWVAFRNATLAALATCA